MTRSGLKRYAPFVLLAALSLHGTVRAQLPTYRWSVYSTLDNVRAVAFGPQGGLWAASSGGAAHALPQGAGDSVEVFRTSDGLMALNSSAIAVDPVTGDVAVGAQDGSISIRHADGRWGYSGEIASETERTVRAITGLLYRDGLLYVLTSFGVGVYDPQKSIYTDSWLRFASIPRNTRVMGLAFHADSAWVATDSGLVAAPLGVNRANPEVWSVRIGGAVSSLAVRGDSLYVSTSTGVVALGSNGAIVPHNELPNNAGVILSADGDHLVAAAGADILEWSGGTFNRIAGAPGIITAIAVDGNGDIGLGIENKGFGRVVGGETRLVVVNTPVGNTFSDLALGSDGALWAASAERLATPGNGLSRLKNGEWTRFTTATVPELKTSQVWNVGTDSAGRVWAGTYGASATVLTPAADGSYTAVQYDPSNSSIQGIGPGSTFAIVGKSVADRSGRTWFTNWNPVAYATPVLHVKLPDGEQSPSGTGFIGFGVRTPGPYRWLAIDEAGTKWLGADDADAHPGLFWYNDRGTLLDPSDDRSGLITQSEAGLLNNQQNALAVDHLGEVWIATPNGISVLVNPTSVALDAASPIFRTIRVLADVYVTSLAVDALDRKWVGSTRGLYLLNAEGSEVLATYTTANSPLVDNDVRSILAVDATGDVYIGTANGLNRIETEAVVKETPSGRLTATPQPFLLPSVDPLRIDGLPSNSIVKILAPSGTLIRQITAPGGSVAYWDGLDDRGRPVPSGVYIIAAGAADGSDAALGKVAVIRR